MTIATVGLNAFVGGVCAAAGGQAYHTAAPHIAEGARKVDEFVANHSSACANISIIAAAISLTAGFAFPAVAGIGCFVGAPIAAIAHVYSGMKAEQAHWEKSQQQHKQN